MQANWPGPSDPQTMALIQTASVPPTDSVDAAQRGKIADAQNKFEGLVQMVKNSDEGIEFLTTSLVNMEQHL